MTRPNLLWIPFVLVASAAVAGTIPDGPSRRVSEPGGIPQRVQDVPRPTVVTVSGTVSKGSWKHYGPNDLPVGKSLAAKLSVAGDADLYVRKGSTPNYSTFDCRPYTATPEELCTVSGAGKVYVSVNGYAASSTFSLQISYPLSRPHQAIPGAPRPSPKPRTSGCT